MNTKKFSIDQIAEIRNLKYAYAGHCDGCGKGSVDMTNYPKPIIRFKVELFDGSKFLLCDECGEAVRKGLMERNKGEI